MPKGKIESESLSQREGLFGQIKLGESYTSLLLGIVVVIVASILLIGVVKNRNAANKLATQQISSDKIEKSIEEKSSSQYTVSAGDNLWSISEKVYKSGYNWVEIADANKLDNPDVIETGTKLVLPKIEAKAAVSAEISNSSSTPINAITGATYTIQKGDDLWDIAVRAYGDGYAWVKIANANKLDNPDVIHSGNQLKIPR